MFARLFRRPYQACQRKEAEDHESLLHSSDPDCSAERPCQHAHDSGVKIAVRTTIICTVVWAAIAIWFGGSLRGASFVADADDFCLNHISRYSPVVKEVKANWHTIQYNGSFFHQSIFRQDASPEVDAAWASLGVNYRSVVIPESEAEKTGLRRDQVKISQRYGGGYPANIEGLHHLHCLDLLRKALKWNYAYYQEKKEGPFINSEFVVKYHVTHCMDIIRQQLMCTTDIGVLGQVWYHPENESAPIPFVDFNTKHKCRDYEAIRQWAEEHQLPVAEEVDMNAFYEPPKPGDRIFPEIP